MDRKPVLFIGVSPWLPSQRQSGFIFSHTPFKIDLNQDKAEKRERIIDWDFWSRIHVGPFGQQLDVSCC